MKKMLYVCAALVMAFGTAVTARAADVTGSWTADMQSPDGNSMQISFTFKQDGAVLTGTVSAMQGDPMPFSEGKVDGNKISFKVSFNGMTITHEGTISENGDEIKLTSKSDSGDFPGMDFTLKRVKASAPVTAPAP